MEWASLHQRYARIPSSLGEVALPIYNQAVKRRQLAGPFAECLDGITMQLGAVGYSGQVVSQYQSGLVHLALWCNRKGILPAAFNDAAVARFTRHARRCNCRPTGVGRPRRAARGVRDARVARAVLRYLRSLEVAPPATEPRSPPLLAGFVEWLRHRGLAAKTAGHRTRWSKLLVESLGSHPARYRPADIREFLAAQCQKRHYHHKTSQQVVGAVRCFLRYLVMHGRCSHRLLEALPRLASWRRAGVPRYISASQVERTISTPARTTAVGQRDRAILLLLARLGLRSSEVAQVKLDDIDWTNRRIRVVGGKTGQVAWLPLPSDVSQAIRTYIGKGRPSTPDEHVFVRTRAPFVAGSRPSMIGHLVIKALRQAKVDAPIWGPHVFRHSLATNLLRDGWSLQAIGALLRHRSPETTAIYAKVDFSTLRLVVQPWPDNHKMR